MLTGHAAIAQQQLCHQTVAGACGYGVNLMHSDTLLRHCACKPHVSLPAGKGLSGGCYCSLVLVSAPALMPVLPLKRFGRIGCQVPLPRCRRRQGKFTWRSMAISSCCTWALMRSNTLVAPAMAGACSTSGCASCPPGLVMSAVTQGVACMHAFEALCRAAEAAWCAAWLLDNMSPDHWWLITSSGCSSSLLPSADQNNQAQACAASSHCAVHERGLHSTLHQSPGQGPPSQTLRCLWQRQPSQRQPWPWLLLPAREHQHSSYAADDVP